MKRRKRRQRFSLASRRLREIERTMPLLDFVAMQQLLPVVARTYRVILAERLKPPTSDELAERIKGWWAPRAPIFTDQEIAAAAYEACKDMPKLDRADTLARLIGLEYADRQRLRIFTIGAIDKTKRQRAALKKARHRAAARTRAARKRAERGAIPRTQYLAQSLTRTRPWLTEGISRRTWERRRKNAAQAPSVSQVGFPLILRGLPGNQPATTADEQPHPQQQRRALNDSGAPHVTSGPM
jgi:hypothetical protein